MMPTRVLVVEDSPTQSEALRNILESAGFEVRMAADGRAGLATFNAGHFDVVISDIVMPGPVDGYKLCKKIKRGKGPDTPVVLLTSLSSPLDIIHGLECGADNFFTKPYDAQHLVERLQTLLRTRRARADTRMRVGVEVFFMDHKFTISSDREQILDLLISTFEDAVRQNQDLRKREEELTRAKAELSRYAQTLEGRLQSVLSSVPDMLFSMRADLSALYYVSPASTTVTGYDPEYLAEDAGRVLGLMDPADAALFGTGVQRAQDGHSATVEHRLRHRDGSTRLLHTTLVPVRDDAGEVLRLDGTSRDITHQRQLEDQLRQAQKMESLGRLAGGVAHDFNNLLTVIRGYCDLVMLETAEDDPRRQDFLQIRIAADSAAVLSRQLLAFSRPQLLFPVVLDLNETVRGVNMMLQRVTPSSVQLATRLAEELQSVKVDPGHIEQVLMNLAVNAIDAMPNGGRLLVETSNAVLDDRHVELPAGVAPGPYVMLAVSDTGTGMDQTTLGRIFEPFFTTKPAEKGTGLGLATVYGIVQKSGGHCTVSSVVGQGTTFRIYFPRSEPSVEEVQEKSALPGEAGAAEGGGTVMIVDDQAPVRKSLMRMLEERGYRVLGAGSGAEGLRIADAHPGPIPVVISDLMMPEMSGREFAERLTRTRPEVHILFMSGGLDDAVYPGLVPSEHAFIQKPFTIDEISNRVREMLER